MHDMWDPMLYRESSEMQKRWAQTLLEAIDFDTAKTVIDVGSGDGDITFGIAKQYPKSMVIGLDISEKMVTFANQNHKTQDNLTFIQADAEKLLFLDQVDVVCSFNTIHRLSQPKMAISGIFRALKPGGKFIAAFPVNGSPIMSEAIAHVDTQPKWKIYFNTPDRKAYTLSDTLIKEWLTNAGFLIIKAKTKWADEIFESREKFRDLLRATFSHRSSLPVDKEIEFFEELVDEYLKKFPLDEKGRVHFYFNRVEIIAVKPGINKPMPGTHDRNRAKL